MPESVKSYETGFVAKQKILLEKRLEECLAEQKEMVKRFSTIERLNNNSADLARAILDEEENVLRANNCSNMIFKISAAILAIEEGAYGVCADCEGQIPKKRLGAIPWATVCVGCQQAKEEKKEENNGSN